MKTTVTLLALLLASAEDIKHLLIPNIFAVLIIIFCGRPHIIDGTAVLLIWFTSVLLTTMFNLPVPFGMGDAKLLAALAFSFGLPSCAEIFSIAALLSGISAAIILVLASVLKLPKPEELPFAPFISAGFIITVLFRVF